jgi:hypothetical protein
MSSLNQLKQKEIIYLKYIACMCYILKIQNELDLKKIIN